MDSQKSCTVIVVKISCQRSYNDSVKLQASGELTQHLTTLRVTINVSVLTKPCFKCFERCPMTGRVTGSQPFLPWCMRIIVQRTNPRAFPRIGSCPVERQV
ncbi:hypothetical protein DPMN_072117 [Dreissena polymorpha]|uniref:Uncharacterized protein n=1 Tax=Dreissena polymorpha TaxID=45954 RepID=A0A9D3Z5Y0_DREPO|nr:hypothetical protein DPMN_072117 [Dreissena polymorpha]